MLPCLNHSSLLFGWSHRACSPGSGNVPCYVTLGHSSFPPRAPWGLCRRMSPAAVMVTWLYHLAAQTPQKLPPPNELWNHGKVSSLLPHWQHSYRTSAMPHPSWRTSSRVTGSLPHLLPSAAEPWGLSNASSLLLHQKHSYRNSAKPSPIRSTSATASLLLNLQWEGSGVKKMSSVLQKWWSRTRV